MSDTLRPIPRRLLAQFLTDYESIKTFEQVQTNAVQLLPKELEEVLNVAMSSDSKSDIAIAAINRLSAAIELAATAPPDVILNADDNPLPVIREANIDAPHGEMYATNVSEVVAVAAVDTAYEITAGLAGGLVRLMSFGGAHYLQAERHGRYLVTFSISIDTASAADEIEGGIMIDGTAQSKGTAHTTVPAGNSASTIASSVIVDLNALQQISLFVINHTAVRDITVEHATMTAVKIGDLT